MAKKTEGCCEQGLIMWWSTFYQRWNLTPWKGILDEGKGETRQCKGKPIISNNRLLDVICKEAARIYEDTSGEAHLVESAYSAIWCDDPKQKDFLRNKIEWLVCHEV